MMKRRRARNKGDKKGRRRREGREHKWRGDEYEIKEIKKEENGENINVKEKRTK